MRRVDFTKANKLDRLIIIAMPICVSALAMILFFKCGISVEIEVGHGLIEIMINVWGVLLGFVITAVSILLTMGENELVTLLKETNHMSNIVLSYVLASTYLFLALTYSIIILFSGEWGKIIYIFFLGLNVLVAITIGFCLYFLFLIALTLQKQVDPE